MQHNPNKFFITKHHVHLLGQSVVFWTFSMGLLGIIRYWGIESELGISIESEYLKHYTFFPAMFPFLLLGCFLGSQYPIVHFVFERIVSNKLTFGLKILIRNILYFITTIMAFYAIINLYPFFYETNLQVKYEHWAQDKTLWAFLVYIVFASFMFSFLIIGNEKFGKGVFLKILLGKYKTPKEEKRIFMFLDLKSSTTIAEELGHFKYSQFIQDCFYDLNEIIQKYDSEIYQYIGDEAVLCWPYHKGIKRNNCIQLFFTFQRKLADKRAYYLAKYNTIPEFKAGLHGGKLMIAEVGTVKKELAYHGDVINTSARLQNACNTYQVPIIVSEQLILDLNIVPYYSSYFLGNTLLKGKHQEINIYTLSEKL